MGEAPENSTQANTDRSVSRRRALQAGAALGVGATAWTGPKIGAFGAVPAYAAVCSPEREGPFTETAEATGTITGNNVFTYGALTFSDNSSLFSPSAVAGSTNGSSVVAVNGSSTLYCQMTVSITLNGNTEAFPSPSGLASGNPVSLTMPSVTRNAVSNNPGDYELTVEVRCSSDRGCFPP